MMGAQNEIGARKRQSHLVVYGLLLAGAVIFLLPFYWMVISALQPSYAVLDFRRAGCRFPCAGLIFARR